jgi:hypothetical protein
MSGYARKMARRQMKAGSGLRRRMMRDNTDLLQNIEFVFNSAYRQWEGVDDAVCHAAIESALTGVPAHNPISALLVENLGRVRRLRPELPDEDWRNALRVVAESIRTHSSRRAGEVDYLAFIDDFFP